MLIKEQSRREAMYLWEEKQIFSLKGDLPLPPSSLAKILHDLINTLMYFSHLK